MRYTVVWSVAAQNELARIWLQASDRQAVTKAANRIDAILAVSPETKGEEFYRDRLIVDPPLHVVFAVSPDDRRVEVLHIWYV
jgi:plasmid stabilization system protein ParE